MSCNNSKIKNAGNYLTIVIYIALKILRKIFMRYDIQFYVSVLLALFTCGNRLATTHICGPTSIYQHTEDSNAMIFGADRHTVDIRAISMSAIGQDRVNGCDLLVLMGKPWPMV